MHTLSLLALSFALTTAPSSARPIVPVAAEATEAAKATEAAEVAQVTRKVDEPAPPALYAQDLALVALGGAAGILAGLPLVYAAHMLTPDLIAKDVFLTSALLLLVPAPLFASGLAAASAYARDLPGAQGGVRVASTALGAGTGGFAGMVVGAIWGSTVPCSGGWLCGLQYVLLGGFGGAVVGSALGSAGGILVADGLFALGRSEGEE